MSVPGGPEVVRMSHAEWDAAVQRELARLGCTFEELADMARRDDFDTVDARKLWVSVGGSR